MVYFKITLIIIFFGIIYRKKEGVIKAIIKVFVFFEKMGTKLSLIITLGLSFGGIAIFILFIYPKYPKENVLLKKFKSDIKFLEKNHETYSKLWQEKQDTVQ